MATITGTEGPDDITDTAAPDLISLLGGDDTLRVMNQPSGFPASASEEFHGGAGYDRMLLQFNWQDGGTFDALTGIMRSMSGTASFSDFEEFEIRISSPFDMALRITTLDGNDVVQAGSGPDVISTRGGSDTILGISYRDTAAGGAGDDTYYVYGGGTVSEDAGGGMDTVYFSGTSYSLPEGVERLFALEEGATYSRTFFGNDGNNIIVGGAGNDALYGGRGADQMYGGAGDDVYVVHDAEDYIADPRGGGTDIVYSSVSYALNQLIGAAFIETLSTISHADTAPINLTGNGQVPMTIVGNFGNNVLAGAGSGGRLIGLKGDDTYRIGASSNVEVVEEEGEGFDTVLVSFNFALAAGQSIEAITIEDPSPYSNTGIITLVGNEYAQTLTGNNSRNILNGNGGADVMIGRGGDDIYVVENPGDEVIEQDAQGDDLVYTHITYAIANSQSIETLSTADHNSTAAIDLLGNDLSNHLIGNYGNNYLNGRGGADVMNGLMGEDIYVIDSSADQIVEYKGYGTDAAFSFVSYALAAGVAVETLSTANNRSTDALDLTGNEFAQSVIGNFGSNVIDGKGGNDVLIGLAGADTFAFTSALGSGNVDRIEDFEIGLDKIALDEVLFGGEATAGLSPLAFRTGSSAQDADDRIIYNPETGALLFDADGIGSGAAVQFAVLGTGLNMSASDFFFI